MTFKSTWVKAHQDDYKLPGQVLSDAALRNTRVDHTAIAYLESGASQNRNNAAHVDAQAISISIQGTRITGRYEEVIREPNERNLYLDSCYLTGLSHIVFIFRQLLLDRTEPYRSPAVYELVMDVDGVDGGGTGVVVM